MSIEILIAIILAATLSQNFVLAQFLGICPFFGVSRNIKSAFGMGIAVTVVMTITCLITFPIYKLLELLGIEYLEIIVFIFVIASLVQVLEIILKKISKPLYNAMGIYLPLITTNCAVLGVAELVIDHGQMMSLLGISSMNMGYAILYGLFAGLGFTLAIVLMSGLREKVNKLPIAKPLKGFPIALICACFIAMAFYVFALV